MILLITATIALSLAVTVLDGLLPSPFDTDENLITWAKGNIRPDILGLLETGKGVHVALDIDTLAVDGAGQHSKRMTTCFETH